MKTLLKLIALLILIVASLVIPHRGFSMTEGETKKSKANEPKDMAMAEMMDILNDAYSEVFKPVEVVDFNTGPEIMIFDFMDNLILEGNENKELAKSLLRCCDFLAEVSGTKMYKMNVEKPIYRECQELLSQR